MPFEYLDVETAIKRDGLRMVVVGNVPSPWGEAAKGLFHIKGIEWSAVRLVYDSPELEGWAGQLSGPVAVLNGEPPINGWQDILHLAERLAPDPRLLPEDPDDRDLALEIAGEICGPGGLSWTRRLQLIHAGLSGGNGFIEPVAKYLGRKYGYSVEDGEAAEERVISLLNKLSARLRSQKAAGNEFYLGEEMTAVDVYAATSMAVFAPLPQEECRMGEAVRRAFESRTPGIEAALDDILLDHRDMMYRRFLERPLSL